MQRTAEKPDHCAGENSGAVESESPTVGKQNTQLNGHCWESAREAEEGKKCA